VEVLISEEWGLRLRINFNGQIVPFFQGPLEILHTHNTIEFVGLVFANVDFLQEIGVHIRSVNTLCMDGTFQVRPLQPPDIDQLFTIQIIVNDVVSCLCHKIHILFIFIKSLLNFRQFQFYTHY